MTGCNDILAWSQADQTQALARLFELIAIPSLSADPDYHEACDRAAEWLSRDLKALGFTVKRIPTQAHDVVLAHYEPKDPEKAAGDRVMFYGHYDVQPADPQALWTDDPFQGKIMTGARGQSVIYGRGAADDKGQLMTFIEALRAYLAVRGDLPCPLTLLVEGDEESAGTGMDDFLRQHQEELKAAVVFVCDTNLYQPDQPAISISLRGILYEQITLRSASRDLHSGAYGGSAQNALNVLVNCLARLKGEDGRITLPGFYDTVTPPPQITLREWAGLSFDEKAFLSEVGLSVPAGEVGVSACERLWSRPTMDINGLKGGYTGEGPKTVISNEAMAKVSFRLVPGQNPEKIQAAFREAIEASLPEDCSVQFENFGRDSAVVVERDNPFLLLACEAAQDEWGVKPVLIGCGGSIPIVALFKSVLGIESVLLGFGLEDDLIHSPNEKYDLKSFTKGTATWIRLLDKLDQQT